MSGLAAGAAWGAVLLAGALLSVRGRRPLYPFRSLFWGAALAGVPVFLLVGNWPGTTGCAAAAAVLAWDKWGRHGKRAVRALGAKSRAVLEGLRERMRDAGAPVPQGARA